MNTNEHGFTCKKRALSRSARVARGGGRAARILFVLIRVYSWLGIGLATQCVYAQPPALVWPNEVSKSNSDPWLIANHDRIRQMRPRLLVLNFVNGLSSERARAKVEGLIAALRESSRYHGYENKAAPAFLDYRIEKLVDLTDTIPPGDKLDGNSTKYPRVPDWKEGINFQYSR